jgi:hypothetical protein
VLCPSDVAAGGGGRDRPPNRSTDDAPLLGDLDQPRLVAGLIARRRLQHLDDHRVVEAHPTPSRAGNELLSDPGRALVLQPGEWDRRGGGVPVNEPVEEGARGQWTGRAKDEIDPTRRTGTQV